MAIDLSCIAIAPFTQGDPTDKEKIQRDLIEFVRKIELEARYDTIDSKHRDLLITIPDEELAPFLSALQIKGILGSLHIDCRTESQAALCRLYGMMHVDVSLPVEEVED